MKYYMYQHIHIYYISYVYAYIYTYMLNKNSLGLLKKARPSKVESRVLPGT